MLRAASVGLGLLTLLLGANAGASTAPCSGVVYLTFDTGNMAQADVIAQILREQQVKATFFLANERTLRGDHALDASWKSYWQARVAEGHSFGNHTWSHLYQRRDLGDQQLLAVDGNGKEVKLARAEFCRELKRVDEAFRSLTGANLTGQWRAPAGRTTQESLRWAASCGYPVHVGWSEAGYLGDDLPSEKFSNQVLLERAQKGVGPGDIVLMHLGVWSRKQPLAPVLQPFIQSLKARGLCFATLDAVKR